MSRRVALAITGLLAGAAVGHGLTPAGIPPVPFAFWRLPNGLRVVASEDHSVPVVSVAIFYDVGSRNEAPGKTGLAHLFEHLMFKGSAQVADGEHFALVQNSGGDVNGTTDRDRTVYFQRLPSNQLDLALFLEADRMRTLELTQATLDNQRDAVREERRLRVDNAPYGRSFERLWELAYDSFAYRHSVLGAMADLDVAALDDVRSFYDTYYRPGNAVLAVAGDVDIAQVQARVAHYFGAIPGRAAPNPVDLTPAPAGEPRAVVRDAFARLPRIDVAFDIPPARHADADALSMAASILGSGRGSRLHRALVRDRQLAVSLSASTTASRGPGLLMLSVVVGSENALAAVEAVLGDEIERLRDAPITDAELDQLRNEARRAHYGVLTSSMLRAWWLGHYALYYDDPGYVNVRAERLARLDAAEVQQAARRHLVPQGRTVVVTLPGPTTPPAPPRGTP